MHIKSPVIFRNILLQSYYGIFYSLHTIFRQIQADLEPCLIEARYSFRYTQWYSQRYTYCGIFGHIRVYFDRCSFRHSYTNSCILSIFKTHGLFRYIQNSRHIKSLSSTLFRCHSKAIHTYSETYFGRFTRVWNHSLFRRVMFHTYSGIPYLLERAPMLERPPPSNECPSSLKRGAHLKNSIQRGP